MSEVSLDSRQANEELFGRYLADEYEEWLENQIHKIVKTRKTKIKDTRHTLRSMFMSTFKKTKRFKDLIKAFKVSDVQAK
jgi:hypothetical protein